jgi:glyoxylase-like metal-dependent hydrolase (beta-lactamase superfamily II)/predicted ester cyclase
MASTEERTASSAEEVARGYFGALERGDRNAQREWYHEEGGAHIQGALPPTDKAGVVAYFDEMYGASPDMRFQILDILAHGDKAAVHWRITGTFAGPGTLNGLEPNGARLDLQGCDVITVRDGKVAWNDAYTDNMTIARQLGLMPPLGSKTEERMTKAFNAGTRMKSRVTGALEDVAEGVWLLRGGFPEKTMNVYLVRDGDGVLAFDAGISSMTNAIAREAAGLGGLTRVVLGHGHQDHRGAAPGLGVPVYCHPADRTIAEGDGGYSGFDFSKLPWHGRMAYPRLLKWWDGGPVEIAGTVDEGDEIAGFRVIHIPGHADGMIALWRESDRLALSSDCFYTIDPLSGRKGEPRVPLAAFNLDTEQARASVRKLAALEPSAAWPGHAEAVTGNVREQLERAADST